MIYLFGFFLLVCFIHWENEKRFGLFVLPAIDTTPNNICAANIYIGGGVIDWSIAPAFVSHVLLYKKKGHPPLNPKKNVYGGELYSK
jgi:hypothetical protein